MLDAEIEAGSEARIRLALVPYAGPDVVRTVSVPIPAHLAGKTVKLSIKPGYREQRDQPDPENVGELIAVLQDPVYPPKSIVVTYKADASAIAYRGVVADHLPPGAIDLMTPTTSSVMPRPFPSTTRHVVRLPVYMVGEDSVTVKVKPVLR